MKTPSSSLSRTVGIALFAVAIVSQFAPTDAFMEDICINPTVGGFRNLYQLAFNAGCKVGQVTQGCVQAVLAPGLFPPACCMGSIHHLTTYMLAQTQGLKSDLAFQLALYNSAIDPPSLTLCDACGMPIAERYNAPSMLGISRLNINTGGILMHQPATWMGHLGNGLNPDVHNHETEGYIASYRDWAFSTAEDEEVHGASHYATHHDACVYGYTVPGVNYNPFSGEVCQNSGYINATIPIMIMPNGVDMTAAQVTALWTTNPQGSAMFCKTCKTP